MTYPSKKSVDVRLFAAVLCFVSLSVGMFGAAIGRATAPVAPVVVCPEPIAAEFVGVTGYPIAGINSHLLWVVQGDWVFATEAEAEAFAASIRE